MGNNTAICIKLVHQSVLFFFPFLIIFKARAFRDGLKGRTGLRNYEIVLYYYPSVTKTHVQTVFTTLKICHFHAIWFADPLLHKANIVEYSPLVERELVKTQIERHAPQLTNKGNWRTIISRCG